MNMLTNLFKPAEGPVTVDSTPDTPALEGLDKWGKLVENQDSGDSPSDTSKQIFDPVEILKDPEALERISDSLDFTQSISAETQQKLTDNAPDAIISLVTDVGKAAYLQAIQHSSALSQQHVADIIVQQQGQTKDAIKSGLGTYELEQALPEIKNPIIRMGIESFVDKLKIQNPSISGSDIANNVKGYLKEMNTALSPESSPKAGNEAEGTDWLTEMGFPPTK